MFDFDPIYVIYLLVAASAGMLFEGIYLLFFTGASYRQNVNRRLKLLKNEPNRENILVKLRRERGLSTSGNYSLSVVSFNQRLLQSGLTVGMKKLFMLIALGAVIAFFAGLIWRGSVLEACLMALFCGLILPYFVLRYLRNRRQKQFAAQF